MSLFQEFKLFLVEASHLAKDALHIYVGLIVFFAAAALLKAPIRTVKPLLAVLLVAVAGELWDTMDTLAAGETPPYARSLKDIVNTSFWPTMLFLLARYTRLLRR